MKQQICRDIEVALGEAMRTPKNFQHLSERIYERLHQMVSPTTLKRIWGYVDSTAETRESTLNLLARYLGYRDWADYRTRRPQSPTPQSSPVLNRRLSVANELQCGDRLRLTWLPDRTCDVVYEGDFRFRVVASRHTRLQAGNTFRCSLLIEGEPLYLDDLRQGQLSAVAYVCGTQGGIRFERLPAPEPIDQQAPEND